MDFFERCKTKTKPYKLNASKTANQLNISRRGPGREFENIESAISTIIIPYFSRKGLVSPSLLKNSFRPSML